MIQIRYDISSENDEELEVSPQERNGLYAIVGKLGQEMEMADSVSFVFIMDIFEEEFSEKDGQMVVERDGHRIYIRHGSTFYHEESHTEGLESYLTNLGREGRLYVTTATYGENGDIELWVFRYNKATALAA